MEQGTKQKIEHYKWSYKKDKKKDRNRAGYQNIQTFLSRSEPKVETDSLKEILSDMQDRDIISNRGKETTKSFSVNEKTTDIQESCETSNCDDATNNVMNFIDESFNQILGNKIKTEIETALDTELKKLLKDVNGEQVIKVTETKDNIIKSLNDEIAFLRGELENKSSS